jgi:hypothetical protein
LVLDFGAKQGGWAPGLVTEIDGCKCNKKAKGPHLYHVHITFMDGSVSVVHVLPDGDLENVELQHLVVTYLLPTRCSSSAPLKRKKREDDDKRGRGAPATRLIAKGRATTSA